MRIRILTITGRLWGDLVLKKLYDKSEIWFAVLWIVLYCVLMSVGDTLSVTVGVEKSVTFSIGLLLSLLLLGFLTKNRLCDAYGLCKPKASAKEMLWYLPLALMLTVNLWYGVSLTLTAVETVLYILSMFAVGFLEEVIFRGLLFASLEKDNLTVAILVSSLTFGMGHLINLFNGSGAALLPSVLQVVYATAAGFMFTAIFIRSRSLIYCIAAHCLFNALSVFANDSALTDGMRIASALFLTALTGGYALYLFLTAKGKKYEDGQV